MDWQPVQKPAELAESRLLEAILSGHFPINSTLPGERELAEQIGVTRPTLREALQRLARDGWLDIQHGKPTRVRDYWREGSLAVLSVLAKSPSHPSSDFVVHLLDLRTLIAPAYTCQAVLAAPQEVVKLLEGYASLEDTATSFARADWELHVSLTQWSANPVFRLLLNGFQQLYVLMGEYYFAFPECRQHSRGFYQSLLDCARRGADHEAESLTRHIMEESLELWQKMQKEN
jgi:GntR family transcriptional regulator, negative regulator for fad regulon and positive regulator of fabA